MFIPSDQVVDCIHFYYVGCLAMTNFDLTDRAFRSRIRDSRPKKLETFRQFSGRLASYLDKRLAMAKSEKTYEAVCEFFPLALPACFIM